MKRLALWIVAVLAAASLGAAWMLKAPCTDTPWVDEFQYRHYCYSDVLPLWFGKQLEHDALPYIDVPNEYPVLTGFFMWGAAKMTTGLHDYMVVSFLALLAAGGASTIALARLLPRELVLAWALFPTVPIHGLTNWDLLAVAAACWGWHEWVKGRRFSSALLFGLGGSLKLYPAFFLPFLFFALVRSRDRRGMAATLGGGILGLGVPNLAVALKAPHEWWATYKFHLDRHPDFETPWEAFIEHFLRPVFTGYEWDGEPYRELVGTISLVVLAATFAWMAWRIWRHRLDPLVAGGVFTLAFCLVNKVYSPQYTLWVVPVLLLLRANWKPLVAFVAFDALNFWVRYKLFTPPDGDTWGDWSLFAVNLRWAALAWATWTILMRHNLLYHRKREPDLLTFPGEPLGAPLPKEHGDL